MIIISQPLKLARSTLINIKKTLRTPLGFSLKRTQSAAEAQKRNETRQIRKVQLEQTKNEIALHGYDPNKSYAHPQPWRVTQFGGAFAELGSTAALPAHVFLELNLTDWFWNMATNNFQNSSGPIRIHEILVLWNRIVYTPFFDFMKQEIGTPNSVSGRVPSDTGKLRETILSSLTDLGKMGETRTRGFPVLIAMNAGDLEYARPVNKMPNENLAHSGVMNKKGHFLFDPGAKQNFWGQLQMNGKRKLETLHSLFIKAAAKLPFVQDFADFIRKTSSKRVTNYNIVQKIFEWRGVK